MSLIARLLNVFAIPGEVFSEVRATPSTPANWIVPAVLLVVVSWVSVWLILSQEPLRYQLRELSDKAIQQQVDKGKLSQADADKVRQFSDIGSRGGMVLMPLVFAFVTPFFWGLVLWVIGGQILKGGFGYMKAVEVAGLANTVAILETIIKTLLIILTSNIFAAPSLALLIKNFDPENQLHSMLAVINFMTMWLLVVRSIGLARLANIGFARAAGWVFGIWLGYTGLMIGFALAMKAVFQPH